jgi:mRNA interferase HigB
MVNAGAEMEVIGDPVRALAKNASARKPYRNWRATVLEAGWRNFLDVRQTRSDVDRIGDCYVFNLGGNKYRLITRFRFATAERPGFVRVLSLLTHAEYDRQKWKEDC